MNYKNETFLQRNVMLIFHYRILQALQKYVIDVMEKEKPTSSIACGCGNFYRFMFVMMI